MSRPCAQESVPEAMDRVRPFVQPHLLRPFSSAMLRDRMPSILGADVHIGIDPPLTPHQQLHLPLSVVAV